MRLTESDPTQSIKHSSNIETQPPIGTARTASDPDSLQTPEGTTTPAIVESLRENTLAPMAIGKVGLLVIAGPPESITDTEMRAKQVAHLRQVATDILPKPYFFGYLPVFGRDYDRQPSSIELERAQEVHKRLRFGGVVWSSHEVSSSSHEEQFISQGKGMDGSNNGKDILVSSALPILDLASIDSASSDLVSLLSKVENPVCVVVSETTTPGLIRETLEKLDPGMNPGKLIIACRFRSQNSDKQQTISNEQRTIAEIIHEVAPTAILSWEDGAIVDDLMELGEQNQTALLNSAVQVTAKALEAAKLSLRGVKVSTETDPSKAKTERENFGLNIGRLCLASEALNSVFSPVRPSDEINYARYALLAASDQ